MLRHILFVMVVAGLAIAAMIYVRQTLEAGNPLRRVVDEAWFKLTKLCVVLVAILVFLFVIGLPHIRHKDAVRRGTQQFGAYVSVTGWLKIDANEHGDGVPVIKLVKPWYCIELPVTGDTPMSTWIPSALRDGDGGTWDHGAFTTKHFSPAPTEVGGSAQATVHSGSNPTP
ncbi:MAG: hypothetical protein AAFX06_29820 [Planctomycetota bacterium]